MTAPLALTPGEPAGIGPELALAVAGELPFGEVALFADPQMLSERAHGLDQPVALKEWQPGEPPPTSGVPVCRVPLERPVAPGAPEPRNATSLLRSLDEAIQAVHRGGCAALVTGPVNKEVIARGIGRPFEGHTQYLAGRCGISHPVMMLIGGHLRVALVTTHLPLREVANAVTGPLIQATLRTTTHALRKDFGTPHPRLLVTGLNPHAGEEGQLGVEEQETIRPAIEAMAEELGSGATITGPVPGDSAFTPGSAGRADAIVCMYHDQGLAPLKQQAFGRAVNLTLGLPFVRTSVDHGTAFNLAGSGHADRGSLREALSWARWLSDNRTRESTS